MVSLTIFYALLGALLGLRFKVLVLVPATLASLLLVVGIAVSAGGGAASAALFTVAVATSLQVGYLGGAATGLAMAESELRAAAVSPADH